MSDGQISICQDAIRIEGCTYHLSATYGCGVGPFAWAIQPLDFQVTHRPGRMHSNADGLSRQAWLDDDTAPTALSRRRRGSVHPQQHGATPLKVLISPVDNL